MDFAADFTPPERRGHIGSTLPAMLRNAMASLALGAVLLGAAGCGDVFRPPVSSISPVGPAAQPARYAVAVSDPGNGQAGLFTMVDFSGDTILNTTSIGVQPQYLILSFGNTEAVVLNQGGSVNTFGISENLLANQVQGGTLFAGADATSVFPTTGFIYFTEPYTNGPNQPSIAEALGSPPSVKQELTVPANPVFVAGTASSSRIYIISNGVTPGVVTALQTSTNTISNSITAGTDPVYGIMTADGNRVFVLNQGSNNVSVINANTNQLDIAPTGPPTPTYTNPIPVGGGPVWADLYAAGSLLVTANSTGNNISVISIPLCSIVALPTNPNCDATNPTDGSGFGTVLANVPVATNPVMVSVLQDGTRAYVASFNATFVNGYSVVGDSRTITGYSITNNVATVNATNDYVAGSYVTITGMTNDGAILDGGPYTLLPGPTASQFQFDINAPNSSNVANITAFSVNSNTATILAKNTFIAGQTVTIAGLTAGAFLDGARVITTATPTQFTVATTSANVAQTTDSGTATGLVTGTAIEGTATVTAPNSNYTAGELVELQGLRNGAGPSLNGGPYKVLGPGLTANQFEVEVPVGTTALTADTGTTSVSGTFGAVSVVNLGTFTVTKTIVFDGNTTNLDGSTNVNHGPYCHPNFINTTVGTPTGKVYVTCPDGKQMTVLETDTDSVRAQIDLQGYAVQMRVTEQ